MVVCGERSPRYVAVAAVDGQDCLPCGLCLQALAEFGDPAIVARTGGEVRVVQLSDLLTAPFACGDGARGVVGRDRLEHLDAPRERGVAEDAEHLLGVEAARAERESLIEERERVAVGTRRAAGDERDRLGRGFHTFLGEHPGEVALELLDGEQREVEVLGARPDRGQHPLGLGGREDEHHVRRRLLERLQQRVGGRRAEHVDLVDDVDLALRRPGEPEVDALHEIAHVVDTVVRRRVELREVEERALRDRDAVLALAARLGVGLEVEAVERLGEQAGRGGLAGAAGAGEQVRVADATLTDRVAQGGDDVLLADDLAEPLRTVFAVQRLRRHGSTLPPASDVLSRRLGPVWSPASRERSEQATSPTPARVAEGELASPTRKPPPPRWLARAVTRRPGGTRDDPLRAASFRT